MRRLELAIDGTTSCRHQIEQTRASELKPGIPCAVTSRRALTRALRECKREALTVNHCNSLTLRHGPSNVT
jgi:hypothetical protein